MSNIWRDLERPIKVLAPMAGYTDAAFRLLAREFGADVVITELISADAIAYGKLKTQKTKLKIDSSAKTELLEFNKVVGTKNQPTGDLLSFFEAERPLIVQLFGKYPEKFGLAAKWLTENLKPDGIDINMGCPARKVVGSDHGAALLKDPALAVEIVRAVKENTNLPVSVKTRLGWDDPKTILEFAPALYKAGIDAIIIHGRTYKHGFKGEAVWTNIYKVKEMLPDLIVIGNGGIKTVDEGELKRQNLNGYAIGQAAFGRPWIFSDSEPSRDELKKIVLRHAELVLATKGDYGLIEFRKHLLKYLAGFPGAKEMRATAVSIKNLGQIKSLISSL